MQRPILISTALILAAWAGVARADIVNDVIFHGSVSVYVYRQPQIVDYHIQYPGDPVNDSISKAGLLTDDLQATTRWGCYLDVGPVMDCTGGGVSQAISNVLLTGGETPMIDLSGSATRGMATGSANIAYFFRLDKKVSDAPDDAYVDITLEGSGSLAVTPSSTLDTTAFAQATISYQGPSDTSLTPFLTKSIQFGYGTTKNEFNYYENRWLQPGKMSQVYMKLDGSAGSIGSAGWYDAGGEFQAVLDPTVVIAPWSEVVYQGNWVPADELYSLTFSPGLMPQTAVPESSALALTILQLIALSFAAIWVTRHTGSEKGPSATLERELKQAATGKEERAGSLRRFCLWFP